MSTVTLHDVITLTLFGLKHVTLTHYLHGMVTLLTMTLFFWKTICTIYIYVYIFFIYTLLFPFLYFLCIFGVTGKCNHLNFPTDVDLFESVNILLPCTFLFKKSVY